ncbi:glycosyl-phosphatidylinositol-anchored molecule-like protein [Ochotona princeps]|uniref:glycosyl-phosphatidylinositol-anchored molecule-like protein n=1 Tax=Ochotona princeps TaxID=9978 RepID=UPI002714A7EF|nr:glycosyl-phosphatidylinositol-anchored molecule-like protein [Ochotona princeps]
MSHSSCSGSGVRLPRPWPAQVQLLQETMLLLALLLVVGLPLVESNGTAVSEQNWNYTLTCYSCETINEFSCEEKATCTNEIRRCMTLSIRLNSREMLIIKNCTYNCSFVYPVQQPAPAPRLKIRTNRFYFIQCCSSINCNEGGPTDLEKDIMLDSPIEEPLSSSRIIRASYICLTCFYIVVRHVLTEPTLCLLRPMCLKAGGTQSGVRGGGPCGGERQLAEAL